MIPVLKKTSTISDTNQVDGFIVLINKEEGWTSFDVVKKLRGILRIKKIGHSGTLDPFATGLLLVGTGKGTKMLTELISRSKRYKACIQFGITTDTCDRTGRVLRSLEKFDLSENELERTVKKFTGKMEQIPPMYSAKKLNGQPLYKLARKGLQVERKPTEVEIFSADILSWEKPFLHLDLHVSKGTYIRTYAHDLGQELGVGGTLYSLERTEIEPYKVEDSFTIEEFQALWESKTV